MKTLQNKAVGVLQIAMGITLALNTQLIAQTITSFL